MLREQPGIYDEWENTVFLLYKTFIKLWFWQYLFPEYLRSIWNTAPERTPPLTARLFGFSFFVKRKSHFFFKEGQNKVFQNFLYNKNKIPLKTWWQKICKLSFIFCEIRSNNLTMTLKCVWMCIFRSYLVHSLTCQWVWFM